MQFLIHQTIDAVAREHPERTAATCLDETLDYAGLSAQTNCLAQALHQLGVRRHDRVGIFMDKCLHVPVALHGIMKTGAAYVPLDPSAPATRIASVLRDCNIRHLVTAPGKMRALRALAREDTPLVALAGVAASDDLPWQGMSWEEIANHRHDQAPLVKILADDLAYIIYTSGSTGTPKGIMHTHRSGLCFARWAAREYGLRADDRLSNHAPLHFDLSIMDYFAAGIVGAATVILPEEYTKLPASYAALLASQRVTILYTVPFALIQLLLRGAIEQHDLGSLRWAIFGGEPFPPAHLRALMDKLSHVRFDNIYGPAEVNGVTHYTVPDSMDGRSQIPVGPIADSAEALVVDTQDQPVAEGEPGELLVRSPTMMRGYWNRADLNKAAFYRRTNAAGIEEVFFRTGDIVNDTGDGVYRFIGRKDRQVKVRGYRIELDEIEVAITSQAAIEEAAAYALPDNDGSQFIQAQITLRDGGNATEAELIKHLRTRLPWYAVPASLLITDEFPRTSTGKIDRRRVREQALAKVSADTYDN